MEKGKNIYINGETYDGEWKNSLKNGFGKLTNENGLIIYEG